MSIVIEHLTKRYDSHPVVNNVSLEVGDGEFFVLLGSSGSGKTTVLSLIAGLTGADQGRVLLHGRDVTNLPTQQRRVGFVFQNYALFQYMTVGDNIEFGLSIRKVLPAERHQRRDELLELVGLSGLGNRMPRQLSGGQQQRVALARALAHHPDVLLLDEPLGALDAKIRIELRRTLKAIQRKLGIATILVTHDQDEAFDLADRMGVMSFGRLLEVGKPEELYQFPQTEFVATFLGSANLLVGQARSDGVQVGPLHFPQTQEAGQMGDERRVQVLFRPEDVALAPTPETLDCPSLGQAEVEECGFGGSYERLRLRLPPISGVRPIAPPVSFGSGSILVDATRSPDQANRFPLQPGDRAWVGVRRIHSLAHPGLSFLIVTDGSLRAQAAIALGGQVARLAHARVTLLGCGQRGEAFEQHLQEARKQLGSGLASLEVRSTPDNPARAVAEAVEQQPHDLVVLGFSPQEDLDLAGQILQSGEHHLLLVPCPQQAPTQALICVTTGEPGKDDVLFAGRLVRHLGADATLLSVISAKDQEAVKRAERFLQGGVQSLALLGVPARIEVRSGPVREEIASALKSGGHDLLVIGAPLAKQSGEIELTGLVGQILSQVTDHSVLMVRSHYMGARAYQYMTGIRSQRLEEKAV
ncbi:MAG TPA: ATP-binding cassette domain-containing protein [Anaerolineales bacterium]